MYKDRHYWLPEVDMAAKHFITDGTTFVQDALHGLALANPSLRHDGDKAVTIISGGGAGHEPSFVGLVGDGLLSAAVSGSIFASPSVHQIQSTISRVAGSAGTLLVIMNYTGDVLHFHLAAEKARLAGFDTSVLVVGDDVSVGRRKSGKVGRRGLAGTVLVEKVLGALAQQGKMTLHELCKAGEDVVNNLATVGAALDHVHIVGKPTTDFTDRVDQVEVAARLKPTRLYSGTFMTSLDGKGFSITLLKANSEMLEALDAPASTPGWSITPRIGANGTEGGGKTSLGRSHQETSSTKPTSQLIVDERYFLAMLKRACEVIIAAEAEIDRFDAVVGDGDCGSTLARTARAILQEVFIKGQYTSEDGDIVHFLEFLALVVENNMDGTSGALYAIFLNALAGSLRAIGKRLPKQCLIQRQNWVEASSEALQAVCQATPARVGDRTVMDVLDPFITSLQNGATVAAAIDAAREGRESTKGMSASLGRAVYVPEEEWSRVPDPGAVGLVYLLEGLLGV
ncbi:hypothetical protein UA08_02212 [Talaromyces atroroseus]|uniref:Dihydroxyacetone kinase n=1 Tax=Talaromyces atroroseus TaxID=1441469 RepID=A0A225B788_TALAT|nr:hypothetical protein UA08_02212 [Talaromyces atroroseus]OKL61787.1 hypothetical protein UA08_02212 [Talaromyces atroroseus]